MKQKRFFALICAVLLIAVFVCGCAKKQTEETQPATTVAQESTKQTEEEHSSSEVTSETQEDTAKETAQTSSPVAEDTTAQSVTEAPSQKQEDYTEPQVDFSDLE